MTFPEAKLGQAYFVIKATVVSEKSPGTELACLAAKVVPSKRAEVKTAAVEGALVDEAGKFADYAAYNYRVTVTGALANVTLTWGRTWRSTRSLRPTIARRWMLQLARLRSPWSRVRWSSTFTERTAKRPVAGATWTLA